MEFPQHVCPGKAIDVRVPDEQFTHYHCFTDKCGFWGFECKVCNKEVKAPLSDHICEVIA